MRWRIAHPRDPGAIALADRHYSRVLRGTPGAPVEVPARRLLLMTPACDAVWMTAAPMYRRDEWAGAWVNVIFRNENRANLSSELILEALAATRAVLGDPPAKGVVTHVDQDAVRRKRDPGRCFRRAGFEFHGLTLEFGRTILHLPPELVPAAVEPLGFQGRLFAEMLVEVA